MPKTKMTINRPSRTERGSVLIYIFIAVIALTALMFAFARGGRESMSTVDRETSELMATQMLDYVGMIRRSIQSMRVDGVADTSLCFDDNGWTHNDYDYAACSNTNNQVFGAEGGAAVFQKPDIRLFNSDFQAQSAYWTWQFTGANAIIGVGSDGAGADSSDLVMALPYLRRAVCESINRRLQIPNPTTIPVDDPDFDVTTRFTGSYTAGETLNAAGINGFRSGCFQADNTPATGAYVFYAVLVSR